MTGRSPYGPVAGDSMESLRRHLANEGLFKCADEASARALEHPWAIQAHTRRVLRTHAVLDAWRRDTEMAVIRHFTALPFERRRFLLHLLRVLRSEGFGLTFSPVPDTRLVRVFRRAGFCELERLVVLKKRGTECRAVTPACDVRSMSSDDVEEVVAIDEECFDDVWRFRRPDVLAAMTHGHGFVAVQNGQVIGYNMVSMSREAGTVGRLAVRPDHRNQGVGSTLLVAGLDRLREAGGTEVILCTQHGNMASRKLYARFGFEKLPDELSLMQRRL